MNEAGVTFFIDCNFYNNFGKEGGSINIDEGGTLFAINVNFSLNRGYLSIPEALINLVKAKQKLDGITECEGQSWCNGQDLEVTPSFLNDLKASYTGE